MAHDNHKDQIRHNETWIGVSSAPFLIILIVILISIALLQSSRAIAAPHDQIIPPSTELLCLPGVFTSQPQDCILSGPASYLTRMAGYGITLPLTPLAAQRPDRELSYYEYQYARLKKNEATPVYADAEQAVRDQKPVAYIEAGEIRYISYIEEAYISGSSKPDAFKLRSGGWIAARDVLQRENAIIRFQGIELDYTPLRPFAWVRPLNPFIETKHTPGYQASDFTGNFLQEYSLVQVYDTQTIDNFEWLMIGPDEWVEKRLVGQVIPNPNHPEGVTNGRWIEVNLEEQTLAVYDQNRMVFATMVATGMEPVFTRPGLFQIYRKLESTPMAGSFTVDRSDYYLLQDVPWTMYYDKARALHGAYWRTRFGFPQSHGCVNLSPGDAHWLFNWAQEGDWVYVWDPSGRTPTDPSFYGDGGA